MESGRHLSKAIVKQVSLEKTPPMPNPAPTTDTTTPIAEDKAAGPDGPAMDGSDTTAQFKTQLPRNLILQILSFVTHIAIGIVLTPYLVRHLGRAAYGLVRTIRRPSEYRMQITSLHKWQ